MTPSAAGPIGSKLAAATLLGLVFVLVLVGSSQAAPGRRSVAPGRVVFPVDGAVTSPNVGGGGATQVVALPNGGAVLIGSAAAGEGFYAAQLSATGSLDPSFGERGVARVTVGSRVRPLVLLRQPDGRLLVVASTVAGPRALVVARLSANGGLDQTFGAGGIVSIPVAAACDGCSTAALGPAGDIVLTGQTRAGDGSTTWALARLTPAGALDQTFGPAGILTLPGTDARGIGVAVLANDDIIALGLDNVSAGSGATAMLTRLSPMGLPERDFNGGVPADLPAGSGAFAMLVYPDESVVVGGSTALFRYTSVGEPDPGFGTNGVARVGRLPFPLQLFASAAGSVTAAGPIGSSTGSLGALRITSGGSVDESLGGRAGVVYRPRFGGGVSSILSTPGPNALPPLAQDGFAAGQLAERADGSFLGVGGVGVAQPTGRGEGRSIFDFAALALTPDFKPDTSFGGPTKRLSVRVSLAGQGAASAQATHGIRVRIDLSAPGLAGVTIRAAGRVIARSVLPIFGSGRRTLPVELTGYGSALLRTRRGVRVTASASGRSLLASTAHASATGTLR